MINLSEINMIKEIEKPEVIFTLFKQITSGFGKCYYNEETNEYYFENDWKSKFYFNLKDQIHRIGKPAIEYSNGTKIWKINGKYHRNDGPAYEGININEYYFHNRKYYEKEFAEKTNHLICKFCGQFCKQGCFLND